MPPVRSSAMARQPNPLSTHEMRSGPRFSPDDDASSLPLLGGGVRRRVGLPGSTALAGAELAQQLGGGLVGHAEPGAELVAGDRLPVLVLVLGGGPPRGGQERLVPAVPGLVPGIWHWGQPVLARTARRTAGSVRACTVRRGRRAARRSIIETATRNATSGTAAAIRLQASGRAWARLAARLSSTPPASTTVGR